MGRQTEAPGESGGFSYAAQETANAVKTALERLQDPTDGDWLVDSLLAEIVVAQLVVVVAHVGDEVFVEVLAIGTASAEVVQPFGKLPAHGAGLVHHATSR